MEFKVGDEIVIDSTEVYWLDTSKSFIVTNTNPCVGSNIFVEIKNEYESEIINKKLIKLKEIDNMTKIKVSKRVANFIDDYARNMSYDENWKDKLLVDHSITYRRGYDGEFERVQALKDIKPMQLAEILHNGYEIKDNYTEENLPKKFKIKVGSSYYTAKIKNEEVILMWKNLDDTLDCTVYDLRDVLNYLNGGYLIYIE